MIPLFIQSIIILFDENAPTIPPVDSVPIISVLFVHFSINVGYAYPAIPPTYLFPTILPVFSHSFIAPCIRPTIPPINIFPPDIEALFVQFIISSPWNCPAIPPALSVSTSTIVLILWQFINFPSLRAPTIPPEVAFPFI